MALIYADSSALVKRHVVEIGSGWIAQLFGAAQRRTIITSRFSTVEVILASALIVNGRLLATAQPPLVFLAADNNLLAAAVAEGLTVDNPNNHP